MSSREKLHEIEWTAPAMNKKSPTSAINPAFHIDHIGDTTKTHRPADQHDDAAKELYELRDDFASLDDQSTFSITKSSQPSDAVTLMKQQDLRCSCLEEGAKECHCCSKQRKQRKNVQYEVWSPRKTIAIGTVAVLLVLWVIVFSALLASHIL